MSSAGVPDCDIIQNILQARQCCKLAELFYGRALCVVKNALGFNKYCVQDMDVLFGPP